MTEWTTPTSSTLLPPSGQAFLRLEGELTTEQAPQRTMEIHANASVPPDTEIRRASGLLGNVALAFYLGVQPFDQPSLAFRAYWLMGGNESSIYSKSEATIAREDLLSVLERTPREDLEDGMTHDLGMSLATIIQRYHEIAMTTLAELILGEETSSEIASHALRWLGRMKDPTTERSRLRLLYRGLRSASPVVRDGAALGLAVLGAPESIPVLERVIHEEPIIGLRRDLEQVLRELEEPR